MYYITMPAYAASPAFECAVFASLQQTLSPWILMEGLMDQGHHSASSIQDAIECRPMMRKACTRRGVGRSSRCGVQHASRLHKDSDGVGYSTTSTRASQGLCCIFQDGAGDVDPARSQELVHWNDPPTPRECAQHYVLLGLGGCSQKGLEALDRRWGHR